MATLESEAARIFLEAVEDHQRDQWAEFVRHASAGDPVLLERVDALLKAHDESNPMLDSERLLATADIPRPSERPGTLIGPYKLLEQIGEGGFGVVFMAEQQEPIRRMVALKVIKPGMDSKQVVARFEAERQALAMMDHPNIAKVLGAGATDAGRPYFVMELVRGIPITEYCDQAGFSVRVRLQLFVQVCRAVQHAHTKGVIHRDLKPGNVLVTSDDGVPVPIIIDFGVSKALGQQLSERSVHTGFAQMIGTPLYMSPEQAELNKLGVDTRSDIYSLGVLLYELLTGATPFDKERLRTVDFDEMRRILREEEPPRPSNRLSTLGAALSTVSERRGVDARKLTQTLQGELDWIVMNAIEKDRNRRYETASAFAADVQRALNDEPVLACPPSAAYRLRKFARRNKIGLSLAGLALFFIASIGVGTGWVVRDRGAREQEIAHDRNVREAALDREVSRALGEAGPLIEQGKWPEALAEVERADKLLESSGRAARPPRLLNLRRDLAVAHHLEEIYQGPPRGVESGNAVPAARRPDVDEGEFFWGGNQDSRFGRAFREFGIDVDVLEPAEAAERVRRASICQALVRALDEWAAMRKRAGGRDSPSWKKLVAIARQADTDEWRNQFRVALLKDDRSTMESLADAVPIGRVAPATAYLLGHALRDLGALDKAMTVLRAAQRQNPDDFWLNDALGWLSVDACRPPRYDDGLRYYMATVVLRPRNAIAHRAVAELLEVKGALAEAIAEYSRGLELNPQDRRALRERAKAYLKIHQYEKALGDQSKAIALAPNDANAWNDRGCTYYQLEQYEKAIGDYSKAIELDPKNENAWSNRGYSCRQLEQCENAVADLSKAIELDPKNENAWSNRGDSYRQLGQFEKARADCNKALELDPMNPGFWNIRGWVYKSLRQNEMALADYAKAIELNPNYVITFIDRGLLHHDLGHYDKARDDWSKALELNPNSPYCQSLLAWLMATCPDVKLLDPMRAVELAGKAVKQAPKNGYHWNTLGVAQYRAGRWKEAIVSLTRSLELLKNPTESFNTFFLAMAHWQIGEKEKASKWYKRAVLWMEKNREYLEKNAEQRTELNRFRAEAEALLRVRDK